MTKYKQKTPLFDALQWNCDNYEAIKVFTNDQVALTADGSCVIVNGVTVCHTDWILKFTGQDSTNGPVITRYSVMSDSLFQDQFEAVEA